jgi:hypothetical protein
MRLYNLVWPIPHNFRTFAAINQFFSSSARWRNIQAGDRQQSRFKINGALPIFLWALPTSVEIFIPKFAPGLTIKRADYLFFIISLYVLLYSTIS